MPVYEALTLTAQKTGEHEIHYVLGVDLSNVITSRNTLKWTNGRASPLIRGVSGAERELCDPLLLIRSSSQVRAEAHAEVGTHFLLLLFSPSMLFSFL